MRIYRASSIVSFGIALSLLLAFNVTANAQRKKRSSRRPTITLAKVYKDIVGKTVEGVQSAEIGGPLIRWRFAENEPREITILERNILGDNAYITIRMYTQNATPDSNGYFER